MKNIPLGTCFSVPLESGRYGFGFVTYATEFLTVSLFDFTSSNPKDHEKAILAPILVQDLITTWAMFSKGRLDKYSKWILRRNMIFENFFPSETPIVTLGDRWTFNYITEEQRPQTKDDRDKYPSATIQHKNFYHFLARSVYQGKDVGFQGSLIKFDDNKKEYILTDKI